MQQMVKIISFFPSQTEGADFLNVWGQRDGSEMYSITHSGCPFVQFYVPCIVWKLMYIINLYSIINITWVQCRWPLFARQRSIQTPTPKIFRPSNQEQAHWTTSNLWIFSCCYPETDKRNHSPKYMHLFL